MAAHFHIKDLNLMSKSNLAHYVFSQDCTYNNNISNSTKGIEPQEKYISSLKPCVYIKTTFQCLALQVQNSVLQGVILHSVLQCLQCFLYYVQTPECLALQLEGLHFDLQYCMSNGAALELI